MTEAARLAELRELRTEAWALFRKDVDDLREGLEARPIGQRIKDAATGEVVDAMETARDVAAENKAVIGLTVAALAGWFLRRPIAGLAQNVGDAIAEMIDR